MLEDFIAVQEISIRAAKALQQESIGPIALPLCGTGAFINKKAEIRRLILTYLITKIPGVKKLWLARPKISVTSKNIKILNFYNFFYLARIYKAEITLIIQNKLKAEAEQ